VVDVRSDTSGGVCELRSATEDDFGLREGTGDHDQCGPSRVGATADRRSLSKITGTGHALPYPRQEVMLGATTSPSVGFAPCFARRQRARRSSIAACMKSAAVGLLRRIEDGPSADLD
jgi:choline dehydrogenase-like flavoprotein